MVIREVTDEMIPQVREFLSSRKEFGFCREWNGVFRYPWKQGNFPYGYAIVHEGNVIGFAGTLFCERVIGGSNVVYCNLSVWVVDENHKGARSLAVALLAGALKTQNAVVTCFTANETAQKSLKKIGFKSIDAQQIALPTLTSYWPWKNKDPGEVIFDLEPIEPYLNEKDRKIFHDHKNLNCTHLLARDTITNQYCYVIGTTTPLRLRKLPWPARILLQGFFSGCSCLNVCYASDSAFLAENIRMISQRLWKHRKIVALRYDSRLISGRLSALEYKMPTERLCFGLKDFQAAEIDDLYSELVTYNTY